MGGGGKEKNACFALKIAFLGPKISEGGQSAFFGSQVEGGTESDSEAEGGLSPPTLYACMPIWGFNNSLGVGKFNFVKFLGGKLLIDLVVFILINANQVFRNHRLKKAQISNLLPYSYVRKYFPSPNLLFIFDKTAENLFVSVTGDNRVYKALIIYAMFDHRLIRNQSVKTG